jgi:hypothetical protein
MKIIIRDKSGCSEICVFLSIANEAYYARRSQLASNSDSDLREFTFLIFLILDCVSCEMNI